MIKHRIASGCGIAIGLVALVHIVPVVWIWLVLLGIAAWGQLEFYRMIDRTGVHSFKLVGLLSGFGLISATFWCLGPTRAAVMEAYQWEQFVLLAMLIAVFVRIFPHKNNDAPLATIGCTILGFLYVPFLLNFITRLAFEWEAADRLGYMTSTGRLLVIYLALVVKLSDVGAYGIGMLFGKHKLFPRVSPAKTWEGFAGGLGMAIIASLAFLAYNSWTLGVIVIPPLHGFLVAIVLAVAGITGDLFESLLKRASGIKDSSSSIPGMGGALDVLDSLLFGAPMLYLYIQLFLA